MSKRIVIEVLLERIELMARGGARRQATRHLALATLVWPRAGIAERAAVKDLEFSADALDFSRAGWTDRILFKETVEGSLGIKIDITDAVTDSQAAEFLRVMASAVVKLAGNEVAGFVTGQFLEGLVKVPFQEGSRAIASAGKDTARVVARGQVDIGAEQVLKEREIVVGVPLAAPAGLDCVTRSVSGGSVRARRRTVLKKGEPNGRVVLRIRSYE